VLPAWQAAGARGGHSVRVRLSSIFGACLVLVVGCSDRSEATPIIDGEYRGATQVLALTVTSCNAEVSAELVETATSVRVAVESKGGDRLADCADGIEVRLDRPLGDRRVIDDHTGKVVAVVIDR
jgi:hypothetical protein